MVANARRVGLSQILSEKWIQLQGHTTGGKTAKIANIGVASYTPILHDGLKMITWLMTIGSKTSALLGGKNIIQAMATSVRTHALDNIEHVKSPA